MSAFPNIDRLEAVLRHIGDGASVSFQKREATDSGFFTVTRTVSGASRGCSIGQGDTLAEALENEAHDLKAITAKVSISDIERAAA